MSIDIKPSANLDSVEIMKSSDGGKGELVDKFWLYHKLSLYHWCLAMYHGGTHIQWCRSVPHLQVVDQILRTIDARFCLQENILPSGWRIHGWWRREGKQAERTGQGSAAATWETDQLQRRCQEGITWKVRMKNENICPSAKLKKCRILVVDYHLFWKHYDTCRMFHLCKTC